jgi:hypothetical protein
MDSIQIYIVHCKEIDPPKDEQAIEWFLITSVPVTDASKAIEIVNWYLCRWMIESYFKVLKSGCKIEELQFETFEAMLYSGPLCQDSNALNLR